ncbi:hypothetical protein EYC84_000153 [Monilinia fructicola]|uniref:Replication protein A C-terminal domain-containing protein n=1 Tax=Monilinia fructicola TaxID=38448 RepID=A0A5M9JMM8_MONFR|nr:hypothetical protein EYC84_000153 [Monilinia fructicola]
MSNNYGYQANYSTTTYGAQGGADGGGFVQGGYGGSQGGSQDSPGGSKTYGKDTLRPVTIKQILDAVQPHPDADFKIDGSEVTQLSFVGQVHSISTQTTNNTYKVDDGTGLIEVKQWIDNEVEPENAKARPARRCGGGGEEGGGDGMFVDSYGGNSAGAGNAAVGGRVLPATITGNARAVFNLLQSEPHNNERVSMSM